MLAKIIKAGIPLLLFLAIAYFATGGFHDAYGVNFNEERIKLGVLEIPQNWSTKTKGTKTKFWGPDNIKKITKGRYGKEILIQNRNLYKERDRIINREDGKNEALEVTYHHDSATPFEYKFYRFRSDTMRRELVLTKEQFELTAQEWGVVLTENPK